MVSLKVSLKVSPLKLSVAFFWSPHLWGDPVKWTKGLRSWEVVKNITRNIICRCNMIYKMIYHIYIYIYIFIISTDSHQILHHVVNHSSLIIGYWLNPKSAKLINILPLLLRTMLCPSEFQFAPLREGLQAPSWESSWCEVTLKSLEIIRNQQSSDIHEQPFEHGRIHWQHLQHGDTWTTLDYDFSIYFADTCRKRFDPSTLPGHNEVPSWWYSATRTERHTGSPRPMGRWWTVGTWLHQLFCGKRMMSMTADDMYICIPSGYLT